MSNPEVVREAILKREMLGAIRFTVNVWLGVGDGVTPVPSLCIAIDILMVPATVPL
jgi:hypothetical protein